MCGGNTCCLECPRSKEIYYACSRMCSRAEALRKQARDKDKAAEVARQQKITRTYQQETQANAQRLLRAIDAAGLTDDTIIPWDMYRGVSTAKGVREYADGQFPEGKVMYEAEFCPNRLSDPAKTAKVLGCSTDYLLGLTDELRPAASGGWMSGETLPPKRGECVVVFDLEDGGPPYRALCWFDGEVFRMGEGGVRISGRVVRWLQLPPELEPEPAEDPCDVCKAAHPYCDKCCAACEEHCNGAQRCGRKDISHANA